MANKTIPTIQTNEGNVGIGVTSPRALLDLAKANNVGQVLLLGEVGANIRVGFGLHPSNAGMRIFSLNHITDGGIEFGGISSSDGSTWTRNHRLGLAGGNSFFNEQGGNVGIGTNNPSAKLEVAGSLRVTGVGQIGPAGGYGIALFNDQTNTFIGQLYGRASGVQFTDGAGINTVYIASGGKVGIGTTNPLALLSVGAGSLNDGNVPIQISSAGPTTERWIGVNRNGSYGLILGYYEGSAIAGSGAYVRQVSADPLHFAVNNTSVAMSILSNTNIGIGTTNPSQKLDVNGAIIAGINNSYGAYTRTPGGVLKPWFATASANTFFYNTNASGSIFWQNAADTATLMILTEQARLGINTNAPSGRLHVLDTVLYPPSLTWNAAAATIIRSENGQIAFGSDDTTPYGIWQQVRTSSSTARPLLLNPLGGNVGVGVRNPTKKLQVAGSLYWDLNGTSAEEHIVGIQRVVAAANGSFTEIGTLAASPNSIRATFEIFHHDSGTIEYSLFELIANYYTGATTDWVQLPSRTQAHYAGVANGVVVDARLQTTGGSVELRLRSIGGASGAMTVNVRIKSNTNLTETSATGTGATVAGLLGFNGYEFPVTDNRFKATVDGLFIKNNGFIGIGTTNPSTLLSIGRAGSTTAASGITFGGDAQANLYRAGEDTIKTDGSLNVAGLIYNGNSAYYSSLSKTTTANWGQYTVVLGNASYSSNLIHVSVNGGNLVWAGTFLASCHLSYRPNETWINVKLLECATYNCSNDDVNLLALSNSTTSQYGVPALVLKTNGAINGGYGTGYANNITVTVNGPSPNEFVLSSSSWTQPYTYRIATSANTKQIFTNESGNVGIGIVPETNQANYKFLQVNGTNSAVIEAMVGGTRIGGFDSTASALYVGTIGSFPLIFRTAVDEKMRIAAGGNVGIGTTNPTQLLESYKSTNAVTFNYLASNLNNNSPVATYAFDVTNGSTETRSTKAGIGYERHLTNGRGTLHIYNRATDDAVNFGGTRSSPTDIKVSIANDGNVGISSTVPGAKLDVVGTARISANILSHKTASYTTSYPGINSFGADATDSNITYYNTGKKVPNTFFRGVVWTGKHYIFTDYTNNRAYFYDNNFTQITNAYGYFFVNLPIPSGYLSPHGAAWDGRYLWLLVYNSGGTSLKIVGYDLDTTNQTATLIAESAVLPIGATYDIEYADGHLYFIRAGTLYIYKWNGSSIDYVAAYAGAAGTIDAQAITYDGSYLWATQNGVFVYKIGLDGTPLATITSGFPPDTCGWAWNGSNIVSFDFSARDIYIINTTRLRIDTQNLALMGGRVGIGITNPGDRFQANLAAGENILANIVSNTVSASNKIGFRLSELGTALGEFSAVRDGTNYQVKLQTLNNQPLSFGTSGTTRMVIDGSFVGIGSTIPTALLHVRASVPAGIGSTPAGTNMLLDSNTSNYITFRNSSDNGTYAGLLFLDNNIGGYIAFGNAGAAAASDSMIYGAYQDHIFQNGYVNENLYNRTETLRIKGNGRVGIGTNAPTTLLSVGGPGSTSAASGITLGGDATANLYRDTTARVRTDGAFIAGSYIFAGTYLQTSNGNIYPGTFGTSALVLNVGNSAASDWETYPLTIRRGAYVGIGTNLPSGKLHVVSSVSNDTVLRADGTNGTLFSVVDDLSDSLMSVNNSAGLPVLEVFANDRVVMGQYGANDFVLLNNKIGLGTNNPQYELDIVGAGTNAAVNIITRMRSTAGSDVFNTASVIAFTNTTTNSNAYSYIGSRIDLGGAGDNAQSLVFATNATNTLPTEKMRIKSDGTVGIGTTNPSWLLTTYAAVAPQFALSNATRSFILTNNAGDNLLSFNYSSANRLQFDTANQWFNIGNLGVGTTAAAQKLDVRGFVVSDANSNAVAGGFFVGGPSHGMRREAGSNDVRLHTNGGDLIFGAGGSGSQQVTLKNAGNFGINITTPTSRLHVVETTPTGSRIQLGSISTSALMNANLVNDFLILTAPFNAVPASTSNNNAKWGIKMGGGSVDSPNALEKSACIYAVSEEDIGAGGAGAGYNRKVGLALHTSPFDLPNVERLRITNIGNVGIGTSNPSSKLEVYSAAKTSTFVGLSISNFNNYDGTAASLVKSQLRFAILESPTDTYNAAQRTFATCDAGNEVSNSSSDGFFAISTRVGGSVTEKLRINSVGSVGIGLSNPSYRLQVSGGDVSINSANILRFGTVSVLNTSSNANDIYANIRVIRNESTVNQDGMFVNYNSNGGAAAHLRFFANATSERMRIDASNGYVGVGTTVPDVKFDVYDDLNGGNISAVRNANTGSSAFTALVFRRNSNLNGLVMFTNSSNRSSDGGLGNSTIRTDNGKLLLGAGASTYHSLETNGNVGIGLTNPAAARLHIKGDGTNPVLRVETADLQSAAGGTASKTFVGWMPIMTGAAVGDKVFIPLFK
jgi:hypothetical protein